MPRTGTCEPFELTGVAPAPGSRGVAPNVTLTATFSDFPEPETVNAGSIFLFTGGFYHTGRFWVDLVDRRALFKTSGDLRAGLGYTFVVKPTIRSLRGCLLQPPPPDGISANAPTVYAFQFQTVADGESRLPVPVPAGPTTYGQVISVFGAHCAGGGCHLDLATTERATSGAARSAAGLASGPASGLAPALALAIPSEPASARCLAAPGGGLSLCERDARAALVGVPSRQVSPLVLVASSDSSRSYLLRKLVGAPPLVGHSGVPSSNDDLTQEDKRIIQDWIDRGAPAGSP
ncbi:MAG: Ig-like domain-containing protein [Myxococcales bacterium]